MKILVTGGAGYIGSHTCVELLAAGHEPVVIDNFVNSSEESVKRAEKISGKKIPLYCGDVRDGELLERIFNENKIEWVIHFAGLKAVGESCAKPIEYYDNNLGGTMSLLNAMRAHGCKKIVFSSSATVYGTPEKLPLDETCRVGDTTNPYGTSKFFQEIMLSDVCKADGEWSVVLLRYFNPVGAHESGLIGEDPKGIPNNLTPYIAKVAVGELKEVGVFGNDYSTPDGTGVRDYIHVVDLAKGHVAAVNKIKTAGVHVYNLGTGVGYSVLDMIRAFEKACGHAVPYAVKPRRAGDIAACYADASKAKRELGWEAKLGINEMCESLWNWQSKNPNGYRS
ncbi:MAG: UDP-glucose 4-epimerase GalE [Clostridia bacterium]|uniref:UDP-glucose 4-epimerase GalE n=1 Tax=Pumilibacter muris TaxID=2941510 RepID=UPI00203E2349|nr:UDP-glucose 4-epimerase GalE [Pumilibacter muris]MCI8595551.1 UDP-glucose 4-epimerase GalE [Clostridia bacterium]